MVGVNNCPLRDPDDSYKDQMVRLKQCINDLRLDMAIGKNRNFPLFDLDSVNESEAELAKAEDSIQKALEMLRRLY